MYIAALAAACIVLALYETFYNTLLFNCRYRMKTSCYTLGKCFFDGFNFICLQSCLLQKPCMSNELKFFIPKWILTICLMMATFGLTYKVRADNADHYANTDENEDLFTSRAFEVLLIIYAFQHVIFIIFRVFAWVVWGLLTSCCDHGRDFDKSDTFEWSIISPKYVEYQIEYLHGQRDFVAGSADIEFTRQLTQVQHQVQEKQEAVDTTKVFDRMRYSVRKRAIDLLAINSQLGLCPICVCYFQPHENIVNLPCHISHQVHSNCFSSYVEFMNKTQKTVLCPICRQAVDFEKVMGLDLPPAPV